MVRLRRNKEGLELAPEHDGLWSPVSKGDGGGKGMPSEAGQTLEGMDLVDLLEKYDSRIRQRYEEEGKWVYEQHPFWCTGYTFWDLHKEAPDLFLNLSKSDLVIFKGDLNHRKASWDRPPSRIY